MKDKNYYKLTLQFNDSEVHEKALSTIKSLDRKKSEFIAQCVVFYMENSQDDPERIKNMLMGNNFNLSDQNFESINEFVENNALNKKNKKRENTPALKPENSVEDTSSTPIDKVDQIANKKADLKKTGNSFNQNLNDIKDDNSVESKQSHTDKSILDTVGDIDENDLLDALDIFNNF